MPVVENIFAYFTIRLTYKIAKSTKINHEWDLRWTPKLLAPQWGLLFSSRSAPIFWGSIEDLIRDWFRSKTAFWGNFEDRRRQPITNEIFDGPQMIGASMGTFVFLEVSAIFLRLHRRSHSCFFWSILVILGLFGSKSQFLERFGEMCERDVVKTLWEALGSLREALGSPLGEALGGFGEPKKLYNNKA